MTGPEQGASPLRTTWHAWRRHVDLCRTSAALCRG
ncbi:putative leader peptide [Pseudonocardia sp. MH-G8]